MSCVDLPAQQINNTLLILRDNKDLEIAKLLLSKVKILEDTGCWTLREDWSEYTFFKGTSAHKLSYKLFIGEIIKGRYICHHCDRKGCINPKHLFMGTATDNSVDFHKKKKVQKAIILTRLDRLRPNDKAIIHPWWYDHRDLNKRIESITRKIKNDNKR